MGNIKGVDAICHVVRCFENGDITHVEGSVDPIRDIETINIELALADLAVVENRIGKIEKKAMATKDKEMPYGKLVFLKNYKLHSLKEPLHA